MATVSRGARPITTIARFVDRDTCGLDDVLQLRFQLGSMFENKARVAVPYLSRTARASFGNLAQRLSNISTQAGV